MNFSTNKTYQRALFILCLVLMLTPIIHSKTAIFGTIVHRTLSFWAMVDILFLGIWFLWSNIENRPKWNLLTISLFAYTIILLIADIFGEDMWLNLFSTFERMMGFTTFIHFVLYYFILSTIIQNEKQWEYLFIASCLAALWIAIFGILESNHNDDGRIQSILSNPIHVAIYMLFHIFFIPIFLERKIKEVGTKKAFIWIVLALIFLAIFSITLLFTKTRAAALGVGIGSIIAFFIYGLSNKRYRIASVLIALSLMAVFATIYFNRHQKWVEGNAILSKMTDLNANTGTNLARIRIWKMVANHVFDKPVLGWGEGSFTYFYAKNYSPNLHSFGFWYDSSHNFILDKIIETGFVGLIAYLFLISIIFWSIWKTSVGLSSLKKSILTGYFIAYFVFLFFSFDGFTSLFGFFFALAYLQNHQIASKKINIPKKIHVPISIILIVLIFFSLNKLVIGSWKTNQAITKAFNENEIEQVINQHKNAYQNAIIGKYDIALQFALKNNQVFNSNLPLDAKEAYKLEAETMLNDAIIRYPNHPILLSQLGFVQFFGGNHEAGIQTYQKIKQIAPNRQVNLMDLGIMYLQDNQAQKAIETFNYVYNLDTTYNAPLVYREYAQALLDKSTDIRAELNKIPPITLVENMNIVQLAFENTIYANTFTQWLYDFRGKEHFKQETFLRWANVAYAQNDSNQVKSAFYSYYKSFLPVSDSVYVFEMIQKVKKKEASPEIMTEFFPRFPNR